MEIKKFELTKLPEELLEFKKLYLNNKDPIRRRILSFAEASYFMNKIIPIQINSNEYYKIRYENQNDKQLLLFLAYNYIIQKLLLQRENIYELEISFKDVVVTTNFIDIFFQYKTPVLGKKSDTVWLLPKKNIKKYICNSVYYNNFNNYYYEEETLLKLIYIIAGFAKYEYKNISTKFFDSTEILNYPTLIFANIILYEKGIINIIEEDDKIGIVLNFDAPYKQNAIFSKNEELLKKKIIQIINKLEKSNYNLNDFLN